MLGGRFYNWHTKRAQGPDPGILNRYSSNRQMSRIIEQQMIRAIHYNENNLYGCDWQKDNTSVEVVDRGGYLISGFSSSWREIRVKLHGHTIARIFPGDRLILSSCGWKTRTTKSRLNAILHHYNLSGIHQSDFVWYCEKGVFEDNTEFAIRR